MRIYWWSCAAILSVLLLTGCAEEEVPVAEGNQVQPQAVTGEEDVTAVGQGEPVVQGDIPRMSVPELMRAYQKDLKPTVREYYDKPITVTGLVIFKKKSLPHDYIRLEGLRESRERLAGEHGSFDLKCFLREGQEEKWAGLLRNQRVTVTGVLDWYGEEPEYKLHLDNCEIVKVEDTPQTIPPADEWPVPGEEQSYDAIEALIKRLKALGVQTALSFSMEGWQSTHRYIDVKLETEHFAADHEIWKVLAEVRVPVKLWIPGDASREAKSAEAYRLVGGIPWLWQLNLSSCEAVDDSVVKSLSGLKWLRWLDLEGSSVTDAGLVHLSKHKYLTHLDLDFAGGITDTGIQHLADLEYLEYLGLSQATIGESGMKVLSQFPRLQVLSLGYTKLPANGFQVFSADSPLWYLILPGAENVDAALKGMPRLLLLSTVDLNESDATIDGVRELKGSAELNRFSASKSPVGDEVVDVLLTCPHLSEIYLKDSQVTEAGMQRLREKFPDANITPE